MIMFLIVTLTRMTCFFFSWNHMAIWTLTCAHRVLLECPVLLSEQIFLLVCSSAITPKQQHSFSNFQNHNWYIAHIIFKFPESWLIHSDRWETNSLRILNDRITGEGTYI
jgi:hypothetical protein